MLPKILNKNCESTSTRNTPNHFSRFNPVAHEKSRLALTNRSMILPKKLIKSPESAAYKPPDKDKFIKMPRRWNTPSRKIPIITP